MNKQRAIHRLEEEVRHYVIIGADPARMNRIKRLAKTIRQQDRYFNLSEFVANVTAEVKQEEAAR